MLRLLILADDFTDALDTGVRFAARGVPTQVLTIKVHHFVGEDVGVLVTSTETRHLSPKEAGKIVYALTESVIRAGVSCVHEKTDSTLRGDIGVELEAALSGSGESVLSSLPAFPELGRTTVGGRQYINRTSVNESPFGKGPFEPMRTAEVAALLKLQSSFPAEGFPSPEANNTVLLRRGILIFNMGSEEELFASGRTLFRDTIPWVLAGCAGFVAYLPELPGLDARGDSNLPELSSRLLILCGNVDPIICRQFSVAVDEGLRRVHLTPQEKVLPDFFATAAGDIAPRALREQLKGHPHFVIDGNDAGDNTETKNHAENLRLSLDGLRFRIANALGTVLAKLIEEPAFGTLPLAGSDTLLQCTNALGARKVEPIGELESGIVLCRFSYYGKKYAIITRSGGFEEEDLLPRLAHFLEKKTKEEKR